MPGAVGKARVLPPAEQDAPLLVAEEQVQVDAGGVAGHRRERPSGAGGFRAGPRECTP